MMPLIRRWLSLPEDEADVVSVLIEGHDRIRDFVELAVVVGERGELGSPELVEDVQRIERYFSKSYPLHVADEETSVLPRLRGRSSRIDAALYRMQEQHRVHEHMIRRLCAQASALSIDPKDAVARDAIGAVARPLRALMEDHLHGEAKVVFPAVRTHFTPAEQRTIRREMIDRRRA
ncbi:MAG: hemerythrin domain-containing protein [Labilithrix sp.]|nr:hemerythrin domain-containing protein [Labilithrix sp.]MCW5814927.1 hemerythrin domain-containing protein [Labilithrix sp.]